MGLVFEELSGGNWVTRGQLVLLERSGFCVCPGGISIETASNNG